MRALKPIRRSALISPFGVGAMVDFRGDESLMTAGLDAWPLANQECPSDWLVREERLEARLGVSHFRLPPEFRSPGPGVDHASHFIPFVRFPRWHYCPRCGAMEFLPAFGARERCRGRAGLQCSGIPSQKRPFLIPVRFVAICPAGHIEDFPFQRWLHGDAAVDHSHHLTLLAGRSSAGLSGIRISCTCGKHRTMARAFDFDAARGGELRRIGHDCSGQQPWLGRVDNAPGTCGEPLRVVQRGASNVYFPQIRSAIYIPLWAENSRRRINELLENPNLWRLLTAALDEGRYIQPARCETAAGIYHVDAGELRDTAQRKLDGELLDNSADQGEAAFRFQEYQALCSGRGGPATQLLVDLKDVGEYGASFLEIFTKVGLVRKLRETRVLAGFTRLLPPDDSTRNRLASLARDASIRWLPAIVVRGEGIFIEFNSSAIESWGAQPEIRRRIRLLSDRYNRRRLERGLSERPISPKFVLLHTTAHMLIGQLSFDCGYGSAALRERIYCDLDESGQYPMSGVLIYTASGDSEGTLGGLVRQGEPDRLIRSFMAGLKRSQWCSSDPVCIESTGQGADNSNLAACHGCVLLPETACEEGNRLLDRALLVGTAKEPTIGFFSSLVATGS